MIAAGEAVNRSWMQPPEASDAIKSVDAIWWMRIGARMAPALFSNRCTAASGA